MDAAAIIDEARDHHGAFSPTRHGDTLCVRALSRALERFYRSVVMMGCEDVVAEDVVFDADDIAEALTGTPLDLPSYLKIAGALVSSDQGIYSVDIVENEAVTLVDAGVEFVARLSGRKLMLAYGEDFQEEMSPTLPATLALQSLWADAQALRLTLVPLPEQITDPAEDFTAPDDARLYFIGALVEFMARRSTEIPAQDRAALIAQAQADQAEVLAMYSSRTSNETAWTVTPED